MELRKRLTELVAGDLLVVDVEHLEYGLVQQAALFVVAAPVELLWISEQRQAGFDELGGVGQVVVGLTQALGQVLALPVDIVELDFQFGLGTGRHVTGAEVEQVVLPHVEVVELLGELLVQQAAGRVLLGEAGGELGADFGCETGVEGHRGVVILDSLLDMQHVDVPGWAGVVLLLDAEEVPVLDAATVDCSLQDHAALDTCIVAAAAEQ